MGDLILQATIPPRYESLIRHAPDRESAEALNNWVGQNFGEKVDLGSHGAGCGCCTEVTPKQHPAGCPCCTSIQTDGHPPGCACCTTVSSDSHPAGCACCTPVSSNSHPAGCACCTWQVAG
ncbi:MAG: hypothetical protein FJX76_17245 [Armatimonadetes bacterium]|nr:hypothetical protein [Armatimonadota bacterium]